MVLLSEHSFVFPMRFTTESVKLLCTNKLCKRAYQPLSGANFINEIYIEKQNTLMPVMEEEQCIPPGMSRQPSDFHAGIEGL